MSGCTYHARDRAGYSGYPIRAAAGEVLYADSGEDHDGYGAVRAVLEALSGISLRFQRKQEPRREMRLLLLLPSWAAQAAYFSFSTTTIRNVAIGPTKSDIK